MFTGIIEGIGKVLGIEQEGSNVHFKLASAFTDELKIDQSVAHNGVCLTVVKKDSEGFVVTAIQETLDCTNLGDWKEGDAVNLERCTSLGGRLDGHLVQGHVDATAKLHQVVDATAVGCCISNMKLRLKTSRYRKDPLRSMALASRWLTLIPRDFPLPSFPTLGNTRIWGV